MTGKTISTAKNPHLCSSFDGFLAQEGMLQAATATAVKRLITWQIEQEMKARQLDFDCLGQCGGVGPADLAS